MEEVEATVSLFARAHNPDNDMPSYLFCVPLTLIYLQLLLPAMQGVRSPSLEKNAWHTTK